MLRIRALSRPGLEPVSLTVSDGECISLAGPSGAGKSLLLRAIADLDPNHGEVSLDSLHRDEVPAPRWRRAVVYLAAEPGWWSDTLAEHFSDLKHAKALASRLRVDPEAWQRPVGRLSTGERQRLALVRALELQARVLLLDEPTAALDKDARAAVEALLDELKQAGASLIWVTHDPEQAARTASRHFTMESGRLSEARA